MSDFMFCAVVCPVTKPCKAGPCPHGLPEGLVKRSGMSELDRDRPSEMPSEGEKELRRREEENRRIEAELLKSMPIKIEETIGAKPGPAVQYLQYLTPGSVQYVVAVPSEEWERVKKTAGRAMAAEVENEILRKDLQLNAALLAKQTDLAREAEIRAMEAEIECDMLRVLLKETPVGDLDLAQSLLAGKLHMQEEDKQGQEDTGDVEHLQTEGE